jgi:hypothetical protein
MEGEAADDEIELLIGERQAGRIRLHEDHVVCAFVTGSSCPFSQHLGSQVGDHGNAAPAREMAPQLPGAARHVENGLVGVARQRRADPVEHVAVGQDRAGSLEGGCLVGERVLRVLAVCLVRLARVRMSAGHR